MFWAASTQKELSCARQQERMYFENLWLNPLICNREAYVNCSDNQVFPPGTVKFRGVVKKGQDGLLRLGGLISVTDRLNEVQDLVFEQGFEKRWGLLGTKTCIVKGLALSVMLREVCVCERDASTCVRIRLWPLRRGDSSRVLIGVAVLWRSDWPTRVLARKN